MFTLHDFMHLTKGIEYIIAVCFLAVFIAFWRFLDKKKRSKDSI